MNYIFRSSWTYEQRAAAASALFLLTFLSKLTDWLGAWVGVALAKSKDRSDVAELLSGANISEDEGIPANAIQTAYFWRYVFE